MKKFLLKIKNISVVSVLSFSLCFSAPIGNYYQAAEVVDTTVWTLLETLFLSLGVTFSLDGEVDKSQIDDALVSDMLEIAEGIENGTQKGALLEAADCIGNLINYWDDVTGLTIPQTVWEGLKYYVGYEVAPRPLYKPNSDINLYGCSLDQYIDFISNYLGISSTDTHLRKFCNGTYDSFVSKDYCAFITITDTYTGSNGNYLSYVGFYSANLTTSYSFMESSATSTDFTFTFLSRVYALAYYTETLISYGSGTSTICYTPKTCSYPMISQKCLVLGYGQLYDLFDLCSLPVNSTTKVDYGSSFSFTDLTIPEKEIFTGVVSNGVSDVMDVPADAYDILVDGRTWDEKENKVVGDVVLPIPSQELLDMYYQGLITWQELLESMGITPVNTETGETLDGEAITDAIIETSTDILEVLKAIPQALLDGILGLFLPAEGFIQGKIDELMKKLGELGVVPYDMSDIFKGGDNNPFKDIKITIYGKEVTIVSFAYLPPFLDKFRPVIRGLMVLFMLFYSINQLLALFRISGMMQGGNISILGGVGSDAPQIADKGGRA